MEEKNTTKILFGEPYSEFDQEFHKGLLEIENKYIKYFDKRPGKFPGDKFDRLHNHWISYYSNNEFSFAFNPASDLPQKIKDECSDFVRSLLNEYASKKEE